MPRYIVQFTENGEPIIPAEWWATPEFSVLKKALHAEYLGVIILINGYRSPYMNLDRRLDYKLRVAEVLRDYARRYGGGFTPVEADLLTDSFQTAQKVFISGQKDSLWEELVSMENMEERLQESIDTLSFDGYDEIEDVDPPEDLIPGRGRGKKAAPKPKKPTALTQAQVLKAQSDSLKSLMESKRQVTDRAEELRNKLWREIKSKRQARANSTILLIEQ